MNLVMGLVVVISCLCLFFFFKQKTAYEMRISDWSSDVCSSDPCHPRHLRLVDLDARLRPRRPRIVPQAPRSGAGNGLKPNPVIPAKAGMTIQEIGRASCRERVCQYV